MAVAHVIFLIFPITHWNYDFIHVVLTLKGIPYNASLLNTPLMSGNEFAWVTQKHMQAKKSWRTICVLVNKLHKILKKLGNLFFWRVSPRSWNGLWSSSIIPPEVDPEKYGPSSEYEISSLFWARRFSGNYQAWKPLTTVHDCKKFVQKTDISLLEPPHR